MERVYTPPGDWLSDHARTFWQYLTPTHAGSRVVHWATRREARWFKDALIRHRQYVRTVGEDLPEIREWEWTGA